MTGNLAHRDFIHILPLERRKEKVTSLGSLPCGRYFICIVYQSLKTINKVGLVPACNPPHRLDMDGAGWLGLVLEAWGLGL